MHWSLNQKEQEKLWSVIKMTKNTAVLTHLNVPFFFHSALSFCFCITTGKTVGKNIDKGPETEWLTSIFTCQLAAMYEAEAVFFHSDISSDLMLIPHILFINLTGEKNSAYAQRSERSRSIPSETKMAALGRDDERLDPSTRVLTLFTSFNHNEDRDHEQTSKNQNKTLFFPASIFNRFCVEDFLLLTRDWLKR